MTFDMPDDIEAYPNGSKIEVLVSGRATLILPTQSGFDWAYADIRALIDFIRRTPELVEFLKP